MGTYYKFLRWSFLINMLMGILFLGFVIVPYVIQYDFHTSAEILQPPAEGNYNAEQEFLGLFTGGVRFDPVGCLAHNLFPSVPFRR